MLICQLSTLINLKYRTMILNLLQSENNVGSRGYMQRQLFIIVGDAYMEMQFLLTLQIRSVPSVNLHKPIYISPRYMPCRDSFSLELGDGYMEMQFLLTLQIHSVPSVNLHKPIYISPRYMPCTDIFSLELGMPIWKCNFC